MVMDNMDSKAPTFEERPATPNPGRLSDILPPPMIVYHKGWFGDRMTERSVADLTNEDRQRRERP